MQGLLPSDPQQMGDYRLTGRLGSGGMGNVYLARELRLDRDVALKVIRSELAADDRFRARFREESRTAASIEHPRVVTVFGAGERDGLLYVAMRYVAGRDLGKLISARGALPALNVRRHFLQFIPRGRRPAIAILSKQVGSVEKHTGV